jgi:hypothetical protein
MSLQEISSTICKMPGLGGLGIACPVIDKLYKKESFSTSSGTDMGGAILSIFNFIVCLVAFYFVFKCGGNFLEFIAACCCSMCYIAYRLAVPCINRVTM